MKPEPIAKIEAAILNVEDPTAPDTMGILMLFEGRIDEDDLARRVQQSWLSYPRYRQRIRRRPLGRMQWVEDSDFDLRSHIRRVAVPAPGDTEALRRTVGELMGMLLDRTKPLWTMHIIEGGPGGDALLVRVHHAIGDGMTLARTTLNLYKDQPRGSGEPEHRFLIDRLIEPINEAVGTTRALRRWVVATASEGLPRTEELLARAETAIELGVKFAPLVHDPATRLTKPLTRRKHIAWTPPVPAVEMKRAARTLGVTVNDLILALIAGALRRFFISLDEKVPKVLHASVPVYLGNPTAIELGNHFGLVLAPLPLGERDPARRVALIHEAMEKLKVSPEAQIVQGAFNTAGAFPPALVARMFAEVSRKASLIVTNIPGPPMTIQLAGATLRHVVPLVPLSGQVGLGIAIASYNRQISLGIQVDGDRIPSLRDFIEILRAEMAVLIALADRERDAPATQCVAATRDGTRCRNRPRKGYQTCWMHRAIEPSVEPERKKA